MRNDQQRAGNLPCPDELFYLGASSGVNSRRISRSVCSVGYAFILRPSYAMHPSAEKGVLGSSDGPDPKQDGFLCTDMEASWPSAHKVRDPLRPEERNAGPCPHGARSGKYRPKAVAAGTFYRANRPQPPGQARVARSLPQQRVAFVVLLARVPVRRVHSIR